MIHDVIVIGGGIVGTATSALLAATGRSVLLLERGMLGSGASGRNSGVVQHPFDPVLVGLYEETLALYRSLAVRSDGSFALPPAPVGLLMASLDPAGVRTLAAEVAATLPAMQPTFLAPGEVTALEPAVSPEVAACRLDIGFPVEPIAATRAYAADARRAGASLREGVDARPIVQHGRVHGIEAVEGDGSVGVRIRSDAVVVAAGPWTPAVVDPSGAWRPISPLWGVVVDAGLADPPRHAIEEVWTGVETSGEPSGTDFSLVTAAGRSSIGSAFLADEPDGDAIAAAILEHAVRFVPSIRDASIGATRVCARPLSADERPLIGPVPGVEGLYVAAGHGPWGISTGPAAATLLVDLLDGRVAAPPPELDPARFGPIPGLG